jgi:hypothetical protein
MSRATTTPLGNLRSTEHGVGDPHVRLMRSRHQVLGAYASGVQSLAAVFAIV